MRSNEKAVLTLKIIKKSKFFFLSIKNNTFLFPRIISDPIAREIIGRC